MQMRVKQPQSRKQKPRSRSRKPLIQPQSRRRGARARGFLISTVLVGAYYYIGRAAELQARNGDFPAVLAAWLPDLLGLVALIVMLIRFRRSAT